MWEHLLTHLSYPSAWARYLPTASSQRPVTIRVQSFSLHTSLHFFTFKRRLLVSSISNCTCSDFRSISLFTSVILYIYFLTFHGRYSHFFPPIFNIFNAFCVSVCLHGPFLVWSLSLPTDICLST